jgi:rubrerythrin
MDILGKLAAFFKRDGAQDAAASPRTEDQDDDPARPETQQSTQLYRCSECAKTYVSSALESCPECGSTLEAVPNERDLGMDVP